MARLRMTLACWDYDRTRALADGTVHVLCQRVMALERAPDVSTLLTR